VEAMWINGVRVYQKDLRIKRLDINPA
jgi:hypothetical protein